MNAALLLQLEAPLKLDARTAEELMAPNPISLRAEAGVAEAITLFTEKGITAAPVIDEAGRPIGVVSRSDLLIHECEQEKRLAATPAFSEDAPKKEATVADLMTPAVFAVSPDASVRQVVSDMIGLRVHRLFVVDDAGALVGVISTMDIIKQLKPDE